MISIKNKKKYKGSGIYIGRPSIFGNPYSHLDGTLAEFKVSSRQESIDKYKEYFYDRISKDKNFKKEIDEIVELSEKQDVTLICWCYPLSCHGNIIREYLISEQKPIWLISSVDKYNK